MTISRSAFDQRIADQDHPIVVLQLEGGSPGRGGEEGNQGKNLENATGFNSYVLFLGLFSGCVMGHLSADDNLFGSDRVF